MKYLNKESAHELITLILNCSNYKMYTIGIIYKNEKLGKKNTVQRAQ